MSARVCFVVGARPNFMKSAPVYRELAALDPALELVLVHTGQHYDEQMSDVFFDRARPAHAGRVPRRRLRNTRGTDGESAGRRRAGAPRARDRPLRRRGGRQLDARRRSRRGEGGRQARPHRVGTTELRPRDARGAQPQADRPSQRHPVRPLRRGHRQPHPGGRRPRIGASRREHDDRLAPRAPRAGPGTHAVGGVRCRAGGLWPRDAAPAGAGRRPRPARGSHGRA